jgi:ATPase subunit of ABC transporter with duplicated ATPase domains
MAPRARQAKGKARLKAYEELLGQDTAKQIENVEIYIQPGPRLGDVVVEARGLRKAYGDKLLIDDLNFTLPRGGIVGVIGPNGAGKTTLFRMITAQDKPDDGTLRLGETVKLGYVDQSRDSLSPNKTVHDEISGGEDEIALGKRTVASRAYVSWFNFKGRDQQRLVGELSGGERNRVHLAKLLRNGSNVLLLDEPTNDLDVDTLRALEEALLQFAGARSSSATTDGSSTGLRPTSFPSRTRGMSTGSKGTSRSTKRTRSGASERRRSCRTGSSTAS